MSFKIKVSREWTCSPPNGPTRVFAAGIYEVPDQMSDYLAQRCLRSGLGKLVSDEKPAAQERAALMRAPRNKARAEG